MTDTAQRIAMAELRGLHHVTKVEGGWQLLDWKERAATYREDGYEADTDFEHPESFLTDLNAVHEVEKKLTDEQHAKFREHLAAFVGGHGGNRSQPGWRRRYPSATAQQRVKAILYATGRWQDSTAQREGLT